MGAEGSYELPRSKAAIGVFVLRKCSVKLPPAERHKRVRFQLFFLRRDFSVIPHPFIFKTSPQLSGHMKTNRRVSSKAAKMRSNLQQWFRLYLALQTLLESEQQMHLHCKYCCKARNTTNHLPKLTPSSLSGGTSGGGHFVIPTS